MLDWSVERLGIVCERVVVAVPPSYLESLRRHFASESAVECIAGGPTRWQSVLRAYRAAAGAETDLVAVHDGARPAVAREDLEAVIVAARASSAAVLGRPARDTIKRARGGVAVETLDREQLFCAETPQVFTCAVFERASRLAEAEGLEPTDESSLVERLEGVSITLVSARHPNPKLTDESDLAIVAALLDSGEGGAS